MGSVEILELSIKWNVHPSSPSISHRDLKNVDEIVGNK